MAKEYSGDWISALDLYRVRNAFRKSIVEKRVAEREWRQHERMSARESPELDDVDADTTNWVVIDWIAPG